MKKNFKAIVLITLIFIVISAAVWNAISIKLKKKKFTKISHTPKKLISISKPKYVTFFKTTNWFGKVIPKKEVEIRSLLDGRIIWVNQDEKIVREGEVLFRLGGRVINSRIDSLKGIIADLKKQIQIQKEIVKLNKISFKNGFIKKSELLLSLEKLANLRTKLRTYKSELNLIKTLTTVRSPIDGIFKKMAFKGELITKGSIIGKVYSDKVRIEGYTFFNNPKKLLKKAILVNNKPIGVITKVLPIRRKDGAIIFWSDKLYEKLNAGESLEGTIYLGKEKIIAVPEDAVAYSENGKPFVFVKTKGGYKKIAVKVGKTINGWTMIKSGIKPNEMVVTKGSYELLYKNFNKIFKISD